MKFFSYYVIISFLFLIACNMNESVLDVHEDDIEIAFKLADSNGIEKTVFRSGENFRMSFSLRNSSGRDLLYVYTGYPIVFKIQQKDSTVITSIDDLYFQQVVQEGKIKSGETYDDFWIAPNLLTGISPQKLSIGNYEAIIKHNNFFKNHQLEETKPIKFTIIK